MFDCKPALRICNAFHSTGGWLEPFKTKLFLSYGDIGEKIELAFVCTGC